jgi:hypothetical protein
LVATQHFCNEIIYRQALIPAHIQHDTEYPRVIFGGKHHLDEKKKKTKPDGFLIQLLRLHCDCTCPLCQGKAWDHLHACHIFTHCFSQSVFVSEFLISHKLDVLFASQPVASVLTARGRQFNLFFGQLIEWTEETLTSTQMLTAFCQHQIKSSSSSSSSTMHIRHEPPVAV